MVSSRVKVALLGLVHGRLLGFQPILLIRWIRSITVRIFKLNRTESTKHHRLLRIIQLIHMLYPILLHRFHHMIPLKLSWLQGNSNLLKLRRKGKSYCSRGRGYHHTKSWRKSSWLPRSQLHSCPTLGRCKIHKSSLVISPKDTIKRMRQIPQIKKIKRRRISRTWNKVCMHCKTIHLRDH